MNFFVDMHKSHGWVDDILLIFPTLFFYLFCMTEARQGLRWYEGEET